MRDHQRPLTRAQVVQMFELDETFLGLLEEEQLVVSVEGSYDPVTVETIRVCQTLYYDLGVNLPGLEIILNLLQTIDRERQQFSDVLALIRTQRSQR